MTVVVGGVVTTIGDVTAFCSCASPGMAQLNLALALQLARSLLKEPRWRDVARHARPQRMSLSRFPEKSMEEKGDYS